MRDLLLLLFFMGLVPFAFKRPYVGALLMAWVGFMNPQTMAWGFARSMPFAAAGVAITGLAILLNFKKIKFDVNATFVLVYLFFIWGVVCTINGIFPHSAMEELTRFFKIQITLFLTLLVITKKEHLFALVIVMAFSIGFWGIKGGIFSVATLGSYRVWGPDRTFIGGNNEIALALLTNLPLFFFLFLQVNQKWMKRALQVCMFLCLCSAVFSYSRGAFLALIATGGFLWLKSDNKLPMAIVVILLIVIAVPFIPEAWYERINTIETYEEDQSAMGRINAWLTAINVANDRITGGGFRYVSYYAFQLYSPNPDNVHDAHSIYFEVLGELGYIGLFLFLLLHFVNWRTASGIIRRYKKRPDKKWAVDLAKMVQVSCIAYYTGGAFLGLAYWDYPYYLMLLLLLTNRVCKSEDKPTRKDLQDDTPPPKWFVKFFATETPKDEDKEKEVGELPNKRVNSVKKS